MKRNNENDEENNCIFNKLNTNTKTKNNNNWFCLLHNAFCLIEASLKIRYDLIKTLIFFDIS